MYDVMKDDPLSVQMIFIGVIFVATLSYNDCTIRHDSNTDVSGCQVNDMQIFA